MSATDSGDFQGNAYIVSQVDGVSVRNPPAGSVAFWGRAQKRDNGLCLPFCLGENCPPALALMPDTSIPPCTPLVPFKLLPQCWNSE